MQKQNKKIFLVIVVLVIIGFIVKTTFNQTNFKNLKGGFSQKASYRNDNNTGPIQRIYVVTVKDSLAAQLLAYGNLMPHNKYGNTKVYYFLSNSNYPTEIYPGKQNFNQKYNEFCFALYEKSAIGNIALVNFPFKN